jgi:hypothetical protein
MGNHRGIPLDRAQCERHAAIHAGPQELSCSQAGDRALPAFRDSEAQFCLPGIDAYRIGFSTKLVRRQPDVALKQETAPGTESRSWCQPASG